MNLEICEEIWLQEVLSYLHQDNELPMKLLCDNKATTNIANNPFQHDRTEHVEIDKHFIMEKLDNNSICIPYIPSNQQIVILYELGLSTYTSVILSSPFINFYKFINAILEKGRELNRLLNQARAQLSYS